MDDDKPDDLSSVRVFDHEKTKVLYKLVNRAHPLEIKKHESKGQVDALGKDAVFKNLIGRSVREASEYILRRAAISQDTSTLGASVTLALCMVAPKDLRQMLDEAYEAGRKAQ